METYYRNRKILALECHDGGEGFDSGTDFEVTAPKSNPVIFERTTLERVCEIIDEEDAQDDYNARYYARGEGERND